MNRLGNWVLKLLRGAERKLVGQADPALVEEWAGTLCYCQRWFRGPLAGGPCKRGADPDYFKSPVARAEREGVARVIACLAKRRPTYSDMMWGLEHFDEERAADVLIRAWSMIAKARAVETREAAGKSA